MVKANGKTQQRFNRQYVLEYIANCGWAKTIHIGMCVWPKSAPENQRRMAQLTLRQLKFDGCLLAKIGEDQSTLYALSEKGARMLQDLTGIKVGSGKDAITYTKTFVHRNLINEVAARLVGSGFEAWPEHAVRKWRSPIKGFDWQIALGLSDRRKNKVKYPDLVVLLSDERFEDDIADGNLRYQNIVWVEVEQSPKGGADYDFMLRAMLSMVAPLDNAGRPNGACVLIDSFRVPVRIGEAWLVCPSELHKARFARRIARMASQTPWVFAWQYALERVALLTPKLERESLGELLQRYELSVTGKPKALDAAESA